MSDKRAFQGVWIPAELWLSRDLSLQEKVMLVEIRSLSVDAARGCYKSNKAFAEFFNLSASRVSEIISSLEKKGYLKIAQKRDGKRIVERNIFVQKGYSESRRGYSENAANPIRNPEGGYSENAEGSNTPKSNTVGDISTEHEPPVDPIESEFDQLWTDYPKRAGGNPRADALKAYRKQRKSHPFDEIHAGLLRYRRFCELTNKIETEYVQQAKTFFGPGKHWQGDFPLPTHGGSRENHRPNPKNAIRRIEEQAAAGFAAAEAREAAERPVATHDPTVRPQVGIPGR
ncbi:helix-turn-helix domain-containing protein [Microbulbifer celer]|uniref:Helix-turn-helix domain-containing protein n=1 Tax=Microbulbifer celer TaxID=435905 RepID=A0ABW3U772_9GAMM|nr:helix-turn-helix domain-containing protein [Microbulbifer celer]UFN58560.1 helix-turn-helix domain-containing protein [Microbulbifer celer]